MPAAPDTIDDYLVALPEEVQAIMGRIRRVIHEAVPGADEKISYAIPTVTLGGRNLVSFAAWTKHIGVYPIPAGDAGFRGDIAPYLDAKSTARFPLDAPIPYDLIGRLAGHLATERGGTTT
jgi:uncharacterized protein YdhG (YjbR/CyaY superfamily)